MALLLRLPILLPPHISTCPNRRITYLGTIIDLFQGHGTLLGAKSLRHGLDMQPTKTEKRERERGKEGGRVVGKRTHCGKEVAVGPL